VEAGIRRWVEPDRIERASLEIESWARWNGEFEAADATDATESQPSAPPSARAVAFCAIANPDAFLGHLAHASVRVVDEVQFRDHHRFTRDDLRRVEERARNSGADLLICTEKDLYNLPRDWRPSIDLIVPRVRFCVKDADRLLEEIDHLSQ